MHYISDIVTDPSVKWIQETGQAGSQFTKRGKPIRFCAEAAREGINIRAIIEPGGEGIITAYPIP